MTWQKLIGRDVYKKKVIIVSDMYIKITKKEKTELEKAKKALK